MKGRPLAKQGYEQELKSIKAFVAMQNKADPNPAASDHVSVPGTWRDHYIALWFSSYNYCG